MDQKVIKKINNKKYRKEHPEYFKNYYQINKEKIKENHSGIYKCECGKKITYGNTARHERSIYHLYKTMK